MRKNYVLLSVLAMLIAVYTSPELIKSNAEQVKYTSPYGGGTVSVTKSSNVDTTVDPDAKSVEDFLKTGDEETVTDDKKEDKNEEVKDEEKKDEEKKEEVKDEEEKKEEEAKKDEEEKKEEKKEEAKTVEYTVCTGDYLSMIAQNQMGDSSRWPEIVELNKEKYPSLLSNPNLIYAGWTLTLPAGSKPQPATSSGSNASNNNPGTISAKVGEAIDSSGWNSVNPCEPMPSRVSSEFCYRTHPVTGVKGTFHNGVDLPIPSGTRLNAMANGIVTAVGFENGGGNYVRIKYDNGYETFYCHLQSSSVKVGQRVQCGQQVALSDNTGIYTTGAHLHMEVKINGERVNPRDAVTSIKNLN